MEKTRISKAGKLTNYINRFNTLNTTLFKPKGFTLLELIVVLSIMGTLLFFTLPEFRDFNFFSLEQRSAGNLLKVIKNLKTKSVSQNRNYVLHLSALTSMVWITDDFMDDKDLENARKNSADLSGYIRVVDVHFYGILPEKKEEYEIVFSGQGYCDMALIHLKKDTDDVTIFVEPFVVETRLLKGYVSYDSCMLNTL